MSFVKKMLAKKRAVEKIVKKRRDGILDSFEDIAERKYLRQMLTQSMIASFNDPDRVEKRKSQPTFGQHSTYRTLFNMAVLVTYYEAAEARRDASTDEDRRKWYANQLPDLFLAIREVWATRTYQHAVENYRACGHIVSAAILAGEQYWRGENPTGVQAIEAEVARVFTAKPSGESGGPKKVKPGQGPKKVKP